MGERPGEVLPPGALRPGWVWRSSWARRQWSGRLDRRACAAAGGLLVAVLVVVLLSLATGALAVGPGELVGVLLGGGEPDTRFVVLDLRLPRLLTGLLVGAALGLSGALLQSLTRNPLGSPDLLGLTYGASAGAVLVITSGAAAVAGLGVVTGALAGGLGTALLVGGLAWRRRGVRTTRLVLIGIGVAFTMRAAVDFLLTRGNLDEVTQAAVWLTGSLTNRGWDDVVRAGLAVGLLGPVALLVARGLDRLALGDDAAAALGGRVERLKLVTLLVSVLLAALAVTAAGPVTFVAFAAGPLARRLAGVPATSAALAALVGALLVTAADLVGSTFLPFVLPVGVVTGVLGAPFLLHLLSRQIRSGAL